MVITGGSNRIVGILSERDIVRALARNARVFGGACRLCDEPVKQFMTRKVETCSESSTVYGIMERMTAGKFRHLPVVENGEPVGIVSIGDVVKHRLGDMESESNALRQYILTA